MKIVITGASGLVGHATVNAALNRGHEVIAFYHSRKPNFPESVRLQQMDLSMIEGIVPILLQEFPEAIINAAMDHGIDLNVSKISTVKQAKSAPSGFGVFNLLRDGRLLEDHYISHTRFRNILKKELQK